MRSVQSLLIAFSSGLLLLVSTVSAASMTLQQSFVADLNREIAAVEQQQLEAGGETFLLLSLERMTSYNKGTAILVPDWSEHAASPKHINNLRRQLTDYGWNTLAIMPPPAVVDHSNADAVQQFTELLKARMQTTLQLADKNAGVVIVIAQGSSAAALNTLYAAAQLPQPAALILLGAYFPDETLNRAFAQALATHQVPTLDISHTQDNRYATQQLQLRRKLVDKQLKAVYRQRYLVGSGYNNDIQQWVMQEIYGWLSSVGL
uniref:DUF3530 family protein n=1 Tax=Rheinheimera sp. BAL341 TaxID=1708203 RepID=A0A486XR82_9GAMM